MSGVWSTILSLDLTIPSNGALVPGSGTVYIGGPQLPVGLKDVGGYKSAIVWYSDASGLAQGIDYWFIAHFSIDSAPIQDGVRWGYYPTGGPLTIPMITPVIVNGVAQTIIEAPYLANGTITVKSRFMFLRVNNISGQLEFSGQSTGGTVIVTDRAAFVNLGNLGSNNGPYIKAINSTNTDAAWTTFNGLVNVAGVPTGQNLNGSNLKMAWRMTIDRIVEVRFTLQLSVNLTVPTSYIQITIPAAFLPPIDLDPVTPYGPHLIAIANGITPSNGRIDATNGPMYIFTGSNTAATNFYEGSFMYTVLKP